MPALAHAQFDRTFTLCNTPQQFCAGVGLSLTGSTLTVGLSNLGSTPAANSFLSGFGLFGGGLTGGTLTGQSFVGSPMLPANFATNGAGDDLQSGAGTRALPVGADFGNGGFVPCGYESITNGRGRVETCAGEYGMFTFNVTGSTSTSPRSASPCARRGSRSSTARPRRRTSASRRATRTAGRP